MFGLIKKTFIKLLTGLVNQSNQIKMCIIKQSKMWDLTSSY